MPDGSSRAVPLFRAAAGNGLHWVPWAGGQPDGGVGAWDSSTSTNTCFCFFILRGGGQANVRREEGSGGRGLGPKGLCPKNGPLRFSQR